LIKKEICYDWDQNSCESIVNAFNVLFKIVMKTMRLSEYFSKKMNLSKEQQQQTLKLQSISLENNRIYFDQSHVEFSNRENKFQPTNNNNNASSDEEEYDEELEEYNEPLTMISSSQIQSHQSNATLDVNYLNANHSYACQKKSDSNSSSLNNNNNNNNRASMASSTQNSSNQSFYSLNNVNGLFSFTRAPLTNKETTKLKKKVFRRM